MNRESLKKLIQDAHPELPYYLAVAAFAKLMGVSVRTVHRWLGDPQTDSAATDIPRPAAIAAWVMLSTSEIAASARRALKRYVPIAE